MLDFAAGIEAKNYGLRKTSDLLTLWDSLKILLPLAVIAGALSFHVYIRSQNIQVGYQKQNLLDQQEELLTTQRYLVLEEQTLKDPQTLETLALGDLHMIIPPADSIIMSTPPEEWDTGSSETLALGNVSGFSEMKTPSAFD